MQEEIQELAELHKGMRGDLNSHAVQLHKIEHALETLMKIITQKNGQSPVTQGPSTSHQSSSGRELNGFLRPPRLDFPKFDGNDTIGWLCRIERYFAIHQITIDQKVPIAALHLEHEAAQWYQ
eukprot:Gb_33279 [translate_table: standard]